MFCNEQILAKPENHDHMTLSSTSTFTKNFLSAGIGVILAGSANAALYTWNNSATDGSEWTDADNWLVAGGTATVAPSDGDSVILNASARLNGGGVWITAPPSFTIESGQSVIANEDGTNLRPNGGIFTVATGGTLDLTNGGTTTGLYGNVFGGNNPTFVLESGATARVTTFDMNRGSENEITTFIASSVGAVSTLQVDGTALIQDVINLDLTAMAAGTQFGTYELINYGTLNGTFATVNVLGLDAGQVASIDYVHDFGGGDLGIAITVAVPEPSSLGLFALGTLSLLGIRRRK